jgi:hypothetical protein
MGVIHLSRDRTRLEGVKATDRKTTEATNESPKARRRATTQNRKGKGESPRARRRATTQNRKGKGESPKARRRATTQNRKGKGEKKRYTWARSVCSRNHPTRKRNSDARKTNTSQWETAQTHTGSSRGGLAPVRLDHPSNRSVVQKPTHDNMVRQSLSPGRQRQTRTELVLDEPQPSGNRKRKNPTQQPRCRMDQQVYDPD